MSDFIKLKQDSRGAFRISPSIVAQNLLRRNSTDDLPHDSNGRFIIKSRHLNNDEADVHQQNTSYDKSVVEDNKSLQKKHSKKKKKKKKGKKKKTQYYRDLASKKKKSKQKKKLQTLKEECVENRKCNLPAVLSELLSSKEQVCIYQNNLHIFDEKAHCFVECSQHQVHVLLMQLLDKEERLRVSSRDIKYAFDTIRVFPELQKDLSPKINIPLVSCGNGILDMDVMSLLKHSPKYGFTRCINANYDEDAQGEMFKKWLDEASRGDKEIKKLLQEVLGYVFSEYVFAKKAFMFYGVKDSGKSVLLNVIGRMVGEKHVSHVGLQHLSESCYAARLKKSKLNIDPDVSDSPMKDIGMFKSVVSSLDTVETKALYENPNSQPCYCKLLFGANSYIPLGRLDSKNMDAFFRRILIIPFLFSKPQDEQDLQLNEKLWDERDYIFTWSMKGLKRLMDNNFVFTHSSVSEQLLNEYKAKYCPENVFFDKYLTLDNTEIISRDEVQKLYEQFAEENNIPYGSYAMKNFIANNYPNVKQKRKRINGGKNPIAIYEGLGFAE